MKPIFQDPYAENFFSIVNQHNFAVLVALAGANADKVDCLKPECSSNYRVFERRKASWVHMMIHALNAGIVLDDLPSGCTCDELACACEQFNLVIPVPTLPAITLVVVDGDADSVVVTSPSSLLDNVLAIDSTGTHLLGNSEDAFFDINLPDGGSINAATDIVVTALDLNGTPIAAPFPVAVVLGAAFPGFDARVFIPALSGLSAVTFTLSITAV